MHQFAIASSAQHETPSPKAVDRSQGRALRRREKMYQDHQPRMIVFVRFTGMDPVFQVLIAKSGSDPLPVVERLGDPR